MVPNDPNRLESVLDEALRRREAAGRSDVTALRLLNGPGDAAPPGLTLDRYDRWLVLTARAHVSAPTVQAWAEAAVRRLEPDGLVVKTLAPRAKDSTSERRFGVVPAERIPVQEGPVQLLCALDDGVQTGLFLDHRETRALARDYAGGVEVLNLFAYTCAFSVHAAHAGARRVTSVDVSRKSLDWGRANLELNEIDPNEHRWFTDDVVRHVARGPEGQYGLVILDPPVFGRAKGRTFSLTADLPVLFEGALRKLVDGGVLIFSTHAQTLREPELVRAAEAAARRLGGRARLVEQRGLPAWDHPVAGAAPSDAEDRGNYLKTLVLSFEGK